MIRYNPRHTMADVTTPDGALLGAVPSDRQGIMAGEDALTAYLCAAADTEATQELRLRVARRIIVMAGGTPATPMVSRGTTLWETAVWRHQSILTIAGRSRPCWLLGLDAGEEAAREHGA